MKKIVEEFKDELEWQWGRISSLPYKIKRQLSHIYYRIKDGVSYKDTWNLNDHIDNIIYKGLIKFKKVNDGYPIGLTKKEWTSIIDEMIKGYSILYNEGKHIGSPIDYYKHKSFYFSPEETKNIRRAKALFNKHKDSLWR